MRSWAFFKRMSFYISAKTCFLLLLFYLAMYCNITAMFNYTSFNVDVRVCLLILPTLVLHSCLQVTKNQIKKPPNSYSSLYFSYKGSIKTAARVWARSGGCFVFCVFPLFGKPIETDMAIQFSTNMFFCCWTHHLIALREKVRWKTLESPKSGQETYLKRRN